MSQQINLYDPVFRRQKRYFSAAAMLQALGLIVLGMLAFSAYVSVRVHSHGALAEQSQRQLAALRAQLAALAVQRESRGKGDALTQEVARLQAQAKLRRELLSSLRTGALGNTQGFSRYLEAFARRRIEGVWLTGISVGGDENDLVVRGRVLRAELVPSYLKALNSEEVMRGRRIAKLTLSAIEQPKPVVSVGQAGSAASGNAAATPERPLRFVEFSLSAPRHLEAPARPEADEARKRTAS